MEDRITMVTLGVRDLARARGFYEALGFVRSSASQDGVAFYRAGGLVLSLFGWDALAQDASAPAHGVGFRGVSLGHNVRTKAEVAAVLAEAERCGARIIKPAQDVFWGGHAGYFADPDGHLWEVAYNPFLPLSEAGAPELPS